MIEVKVELADDVAEAIARRAAQLGCTADEWVSAVLQDVAADLPEDPSDDGHDGFICR
ncbi:MAG TPA: hypothetical protein VGM87_20060 [Roseomonas sp.]|jgi:hypothetical protein